MKKLRHQVQAIFTGDISLAWQIPPGKLRLILNCLFSPRAHTKIKIPVGGPLSARSYHSHRIQDDRVFKNLRSVFQKADLLMVNLENPLTTRDLQFFEKQYILRSDPVAAHFLKKDNITHACLANNHILDFGPEGISDTISALDAVGVNHLGISDSKQQIKPVCFEKNGTRLALYNLIAPELLTVYGYDFSGPGPQPQVLDIDRLLEEIRKIKDSHLVIINLHWGIEWSHLEHPDQVSMAHKLIDAGAKIIIGHHSHLAGAYEKYRDGYIFYGLGNLYMNLPAFSGSRASVRPLVQVGFKEQQINTVSILPMTNDNRGIPEVLENPKTIDSFAIDYIPNRWADKDKPTFDSYPLLKDFEVKFIDKGDSIRGVWDDEFIIGDKIIEGKFPLGPGWRCGKGKWLGLTNSRELIGSEFLNVHAAHFDRPGRIDCKIIIKEKLRKLYVASGVIPGFKFIDQATDLCLTVSLNNQILKEINYDCVNNSWDLRELVIPDNQSFPVPMEITIDNKAMGISCLNFRIWGI